MNFCFIKKSLKYQIKLDFKPCQSQRHTLSIIISIFRFFSFFFYRKCASQSFADMGTELNLIPSKEYQTQVFSKKKIISIHVDLESDPIWW